MPNIPQQQIYRYTTSKKPFLSIVTRHHIGRPGAMSACRRSVQAMTDGDLEHILLIDDGPRGLEFANCQFNEHQDLVRGQYVWKLDDDDALIYPELLTDLKALVKKHEPTIIMVKAQIGYDDVQKRDFGVMPSANVWNKRPLSGEVCCLNYIVRADVWKEHIAACYGGIGCALRFTTALWEKVDSGEYSVLWYDKVVAKVQKRLGHGRGE